MGHDGKEEQERARPESIGTDSLPSTQRNVIDLNNEIAGHETGRSKKFLNLESPEALRVRKREEEHRLSALMHAMQDPEYAAAYKATKDAAEAARRAVDAARLKLDLEAQRATDRLDQIRQSAAQLRDGTRVYISKADGRLYTEGGVDVSDRRGEATGLTQGSPSYEDFRRARDDAEGIAERRREVERYESEVLQPVEERLPNEDDPYTLEQLEEAKRRLEEMPPDVLAEYDFPRAAVSPDTKRSAADDYLGSDDFAAPDMNMHFASAARDASHDPSSPASPATTSSPKPV